MEAFSCLYTFPGVDFGRMNEAAQALCGQHDFRCFEKTGADSKTSVCTVTQACWQRYTPTHLALTGGDGEDDYWYFRISADRFLRNMVRAVVGTLLEVGRGKRSVAGFQELVLPPDFSGGTVLRGLAGESVPGHALFLSSVRY